MRETIADFITVAEYAAKHRITVQAVYKKIKINKMETRKIGNLTLLKRD